MQWDLLQLSVSGEGDPPTVRRKERPPSPFCSRNQSSFLSIHRAQVELLASGSRIGGGINQGATVWRDSQSTANRPELVGSRKGDSEPSDHRPYRVGRPPAPECPSNRHDANC